jgi:hypothetical protein
VAFATANGTSPSRDHRRQVSVCCPLDALFVGVPHGAAVQSYASGRSWSIKRAPKMCRIASVRADSPKMDFERAHCWRSSNEAAAMPLRIQPWSCTEHSRGPHFNKAVAVTPRAILSISNRGHTHGAPIRSPTPRLGDHEYVRRCDASMRPQQQRCGYAVRPRGRVLCSMLQLGRSDSAADTANRHTACRPNASTRPR